MVNIWRWVKGAVRPRQPSIIQRESVGPYLYRFCDPANPANICIISAHGSATETLHTPMGLGHRDVKLTYYVPHGGILRYDGSSLGPFLGGTSMVVEESNPDESPDYLLRKYTNSKPNSKGKHQHNTGGESYASIQVEIGFYRAQAGTNIDVVTVRNNKNASILLSDILKFLWHHNCNYDEIRCGFCRWDGARTPAGPTPTPSAYSA